MDFSLTEDQQLLLESLGELMHRECPESYIAECDRTHAQPWAFRKAMQSAGFMSLGFPEEYGGTPVDILTLLLVCEAVAAHGLNIGYGTEVLQVIDILEFGSEEQKHEILRILGEGGKYPFALGFTEPGAGSDNNAMSTTAVHREGKVIFNGTKTLVTNAIDAAYLLTMAKNPDAKSPRRSISMYLVPMDAPGVSVSPLDKIMWNTATSSEIFLTDVELDESCLVGAKGMGFVQLMRNFEIERLMAAANALGLAEAAFEDAATYAAQRIQFKRPIGEFQLIQEKLTDMAIKIENMKNFIYRSAWLADRHALDRKQAAMCKRYCTMAAFEVCDDSMQVHGGIGVTRDARISRLWRDARGHRFGGGTDEIMVHIAGREILKEHTR